MSASLPVTSFAGIAEPSGRVPPRSRSIRRILDLVVDDAADRRCAEAVLERRLERLVEVRPAVPLVPARLSTWHEPHFSTNSFLPAHEVGVRLLLFVQALRSVGCPRRARSARPCGERAGGVGGPCARNSIHSRGPWRATARSPHAARTRVRDRTRGLRPARGARRGGPRRPRRPRPPRRPTSSARARRPRARRASRRARLGRLQPRDDRSARSRDRAGADLERQQLRAAPGGTAARASR